MSAAVVELESVGFHYPGGPPVLSDVDLQLPPQDFLGLIGPNGGGKTTLLRLILGLLQPSHGRVRVFGAPPAAVSARIGYVPQRAAVDEHLPHTVWDVVLSGRLAHASWGFRYGAADRRAATAALEQVQIADLVQRRMAALSGGQRQRVLIARALAGAAELLILDEPLNGIDAHHERSLMSLLETLNRRLPIILVSHDIGFVARHVRSVACLNRRLVVHPAAEVTSGLIDEHYAAVQHDHDCPVHGSSTGPAA